MVVISRGIYCLLFRMKSSTGLLTTTYGLQTDTEQENICTNKNHALKKQSLYIPKKIRKKNFVLIEANLKFI